MSRINYIRDSLWFGEQVVATLNRGGISMNELAQRWTTSDLEDDNRPFTRSLLRNIIQGAEDLFECVFICDQRNRRWTVEGDAEDERRFVEKVRRLKAFLEI